MERLSKLKKLKLRLFVAFTLLVVLFTLPGAAYAAKVRFYYDIGRPSRQNVFGMSDQKDSGGALLAASPFTYDLRIYGDEESISESYTEINDPCISHFSEHIDSPAPTNVVKYIDFECEPGVKFFDLWYKTDAQYNFTHSGSGAFTVELTADPDEVQEFFLSCVSVAATVIPQSEKAGHDIQVRDYLSRKLTPSYIIYANNDPEQGSNRHFYPAVMTGPDNPYQIRITPLDERYSFFEGEYSFNTSWMTASDFKKSFTVTTNHNVDLRTAVTLKVTEGAGLRVFIEKEAHFMPFREAPLTKAGTEGGYDVYNANLPMGFFYLTGGGDSGFLKQTQGITMIRGLESIEITIDAEPLDTNRGNPDDPNVSDSMYFNVNDAQHVVLRDEQPFGIMPIRVRQAQTSMTANDFMEPDYKYEVFGDADAVAVSAEGAPGCEYYNVKWNKKGVAAIRFTYGPLQHYNPPIGEGSLAISKPYRTSEEDKHSYWNPTNPIDAGVVIVSSTSAADIEAAGISTNIGLGEHDTVYFDRAKAGMAQYTFKPEAKGAVTVRVHKPIHEGGAVWGEGWSDGRKNADGSFTIDLQEGRSIVEVGTDTSGFREYHVINARGVTINIANDSDPSWTAGTPFNAGETAAVSFEGLRLPVEKIAGIYNPGYNDDVYVRYETSDGRTLSSLGYGAEVVTNNMVRVPLTSPGNLWLTDGRIPAGWLGSGLGAHRIKPGTPVYPNLNAGAVNGVFSLLPDIEISVGDESVGGGDGRADYAWIWMLQYYNGDGNYYVLSELSDGAVQNVDLGGHPNGPGVNTFIFRTTHEDVSVRMRRWLSTTGVSAGDEPLPPRWVSPTDEFIVWRTFGLQENESSHIEDEWLEGEKAGYVEFTVLPPEDKAEYDPRTYTVRRVLEDGIGKHPYIMNIGLSMDDRSYASYYSGKLRAVDADGADLGLGWGFLGTRTNYVTNVPNNVTSVTLRAEPLIETDAEGNRYATDVAVNGTPVTAPGYLTAPIPLTDEETVITVTARAQRPLSGAAEPETAAYTIKVVKAGPPRSETLETREGETLSLRAPNGARLTPGAGGVYGLPVAAGYRYALEKPGYLTRTGTFSVTADGVIGMDLSPFGNEEKLEQTAGTARVTVMGAYYPMAKGYRVNYDAMTAPDLASLGYVEYNHGGYTVLHALIEAMEANVVPFEAKLGKLTPLDTPDSGVYGAGWVCDVNGTVVADYAGTLLSQGDEVYFYYNPNAIGQTFARFVPDSRGAKQGESASFKLAGKLAGTSGPLAPIEGASVYAGNSFAGATDEDGIVRINTGELSGTCEIRAEYNGVGSYNILTYNEARLTVMKTETDDGGGDPGDSVSEPADTPAPNQGYTDQTIVTVDADEVIPVTVVDISEGKPSKEELAELLADDFAIEFDGEMPDLAVNDAGEVTADTEALSVAIGDALEETGERIGMGNLLEIPMQVIVVTKEDRDAAGLEDDAAATVIFSSKVGLASHFNDAALGNIVVFKQKSDNTVERVKKADTLQTITHGRYIWTDEYGAELPGSTRITPGGEYFFRIAVEDDSLYDMSPYADVVADPVFFGLGESGGGGGGDSGGSGGCSSGALGAFGVSSLLIAYAVSRGKRRD
jgi:hypothetical protein